MMATLQEAGRSQEHVEDAQVIFLDVGRSDVRPMAGPGEPREHRGRCEQGERHRSTSGRLEVISGVQD